MLTIGHVIGLVWDLKGCTALTRCVCVFVWFGFKNIDLTVHSSFTKTSFRAMASDSKPMGAVGGKNRKVHGDDEEPKMSIKELEELAKLLAKAAECKDDRAGKLVDFVNQAAGLKEDAAVERGAMTDASKRRMDETLASSDWSAIDTFDVAGSALEMMQEYELVEMEVADFQKKNKCTLGSSGYPAIGQPGGVAAAQHGGINAGVPLPRSVRDEYEWGCTLITLPALKNFNLSYAEFANEARQYTERRQYARFLVSKFGEKGIEQLQTLGECRTQGFDLAAYLMRMCYDKCEMKTVFQRQKK